MILPPKNGLYVHGYVQVCVAIVVHVILVAVEPTAAAAPMGPARAGRIVAFDPFCWDESADAGAMIMLAANAAANTAPKNLKDLMMLLTRYA
jgi:hypothetical protein